MSNKTFGYVRVSSKEQNIDRQINALNVECNNIDKIYVDKQSGKDFNREQYNELKKTARDGDIIIIKELDRLGRNKQMIKDELQYYKQNNINVVILNIPTTKMLLNMDLKENKWVIDMVNNILIEVLSAVAEEERLKIKERQAEGIAIAKKEGKYKGRKPVSIQKLPKDFNGLYKQWKQGGITIKQFATLLNVKSRSTIYKYIKICESKKD